MYYRPLRLLPGTFLLLTTALCIGKSSAQSPAMPLGLPWPLGVSPATPTPATPQPSLPASTNTEPSSALSNSWFYYFSSLAQTIAAASALLVALALIRLQSLTTSLHQMERSLADAFFAVARCNEYHNKAVPCLLRDDWRQYFEEAASLAVASKSHFTTKGRYIESLAYVTSLVEHGKNVCAARTRLHRALWVAFCGTLAFAGVAILVLPLAQWVSATIMYVAWGVSALLMVLLGGAYAYLILPRSEGRNRRVK